MAHININDLINKRRIECLSLDYNVAFLKKIDTSFDEMAKDMFISSFYVYLNHGPDDFVVDLDNIWKWLGYSTKQMALRLLKSKFVESNDFQVGESKMTLKQNGGQNIQKFFLTINAFKSFCLLSGTEKSRNIHNYYINLERIMHETIAEEATELRQKLLDTSSQKDKEVEEALISQFSVNTQCVYLGTIDNTNENNESLIKFGHTNNLEQRVWCHHTDYDNFRLKAAFRVQNQVEIENAIKEHSSISKRLRKISVKGKNKTEIIAYNETTLTIEKLKYIIKDVIKSKSYSVENFNRIMSENEELNKENSALKEKIEEMERSVIDKEHIIEEMHKKIEDQQQLLKHASQNESSVFNHDLLEDDELTQLFNEFVASECIVRTDVQELSVNLEGRYRLWRQVKPTKKVFHALKHYLDTRFKPQRVGKNHGYLGIKLRETQYTKQPVRSDEQDFIFHACEFSDTGRVLNSDLDKEYKAWRVSLGKETAPDDIKKIKKYLNDLKYTLRATVWVDGGSNEGYYGIALKSTNYQPNYTSTTGKVVTKRVVGDNSIIATWKSIAEAAHTEGFSPAKMSRITRSETVFGDYYYTTRDQPSN